MEFFVVLMAVGLMSGAVQEYRKETRRARAKAYMERAHLWRPLQMDR
jgi:hypothetical protein